MTRRAPLSLMLGVLAAAVAGPTLAARPTREPLEYPPVFEFAAGDVCPFAVTVEVLTNREKVMTFFGASGDAARLVTTGSLVVRLSPTGVEDASVTLNISGPVRQSFRADGTSTLTYGGRSVSLYPPGTFVLTAGQAIVELDPAGGFLSVENIGFESDVCEMMST
jgi:hypothetical protein